MSISRSRGPCVAAEQFVAGQGVFADGVAPGARSLRRRSRAARSIQEVRHSSQSRSKSRIASSVLPARASASAWLNRSSPVVSTVAMMRMASSAGHVRRDLREHGRVGLGEDAVGLGDPLAEQPAAHVGLGVEGVSALAPAGRVDVGDGQPIGLVRGGEDLAPGRDDHAAVAAHRDDQVDEVLRGPRAERGQADVVVADGRAAERGVEHDIGPSQGQAPRRLGEDHVVADQHADRPQVRRGEDRERLGPARDPARPAAG